MRIIMITAFGDVDTAVTAMKLGASEFLEKPVNLSVLLKMIQQAEQEIAVDEDVAEVKEAMAETPLPLKIIAESQAMKDVLSLVRRMAGSHWPVLVSGETGDRKTTGSASPAPSEPEKRWSLHRGQLCGHTGNPF